MSHTAPWPARPALTGPGGPAIVGREWICAATRVAWWAALHE